MTTAGRAAERPRRLPLAYATGAFGLSMVAQAAFLVPLRARDLGASFEAIGVIVGAGAVAGLLASVPSGALLDRLGAKRTYVWGAFITGLVSLVYPLVSNYWWFLALQPVLGLVRNWAWMASQSYIASTGTERERATLTGRFSLVTNAGQVLGPVLVGAAAQVLGVRLALLVPAVYALLFALLGVFLPPRDVGLSGTRTGVGLRTATRLLSVRGIQIALLLTFATLWITTVYATFLPVHLTERGVEAGLAGAVVATSGCVAALTAPSVGVLARLGPPAVVAVVSLLCSCLGLALVPHAVSVPWVFAAPALVGVGVGVTLPLLLAVVTTEAPPSQRGVALGLRSVATQGAMTVAPLAVGPMIAAAGTALGFAAAAAAAALMLAAAMALSDRGGTQADRSWVSPNP